MKRMTWFIGLLLTVCLLAAAAAPSALAAPAKWDGSVAEEFAGGSGTAEDPYQIADGAQLALLAKLVNEGNEDYNAACYALTADIDLNGSEDQQWTPIGKTETKEVWNEEEDDYEYITDVKSFHGQFDGQNFKVAGLYIDSTEDNVGLFGYVRNGTVTHVRVSGSVIGYDYVGGIVGLNHTGLVEHCRNDASVSGHKSVGGIVGRNYTYDANGDIATAAYCVNTGIVEGRYQNIGGIVGENYTNRGASWVRCCMNTGQVAARNSSCEYIGGVVGYNCADSYGIVCVSDCYNTGVVARVDRTGLKYGKYVGGVVGRNRAIAPNVYVFRSGYSDPSATVQFCYNLGPVEGMDYVCGVVGSTSFNSGHTSCSVLGCRFLQTDEINAELTALYRSGGTGSAKVDDNTGPISAEEFAQWDSFPDWDREIWTMGENLDPRLSAVTTRPVLIGVEEPEAEDVPVTEITMNVAELPMVIGDTDTLKPTIQPVNATQTLTWSSSDPSVAEVSDSGRVTAKSQGTAEITASAGDCSAACTVTVGRGILYDLYLYEEDGKNMASVCVYLPEGQDGSVIFAAYGHGGVFLDCEIQGKESVPSGEYSYPEYTVPEGAETVRAFLVDGDWSPLAPCVEAP